MPDLRVLYTPSQIVAFARSGEAAGTTCVVVDQLRATSTIVAALGNGATAVLAAGTVEEARALAASRPGALLAGERGGVPPEGFALGNSPRDFGPERVAGREIVLTTTNGTLALLACRGAGAIHAASFLNLAATLAVLRGEREVVFLCAGTGPDFALEDALTVGALVEALAPGHPAAAPWRASLHDLDAVLARTTNGRRLVALGLGDDIAWSARRDAFAIAPRGTVRDFEIDGATIPAVVLEAA